MTLAIIIPVFNEESIIRKVIASLPKKISGIDKIVVLAVNDGSTDNSAKEIKTTGAKLINLPINLGYGAANITGLEAAKKIKADIAVSFDGDGQHDPRDIQKIIQPILNGSADLVIGTRFCSDMKVPIIKKIGIKFLNLVTYICSGHWSSDSQCGLKAFSKTAFDKMRLNSTGMEFASEIIIAAKRAKLRIAEIPTRIVYSSYSRKKGQSIFNGVNIVTKLLIKRLTR